MLFTSSLIVVSPCWSTALSLDGIDDGDENKTLLYKLSEQENNSDAVATIGTTTAVNFGSNNEFVFINFNFQSFSSLVIC